MASMTPDLQDFSRSSKLEWLETNGTGAFAMGTVAGVNTRRYHGLLIASLRPPVERYVLLSRLEEDVDGTALGVSQYPGTVAPRGFEHLEDFSIEPCATWTYRCGAGKLRKQVWLIAGQQAVAIRYTASQRVTLRVRPFFAFRGYHSLAHQNESWNQADATGNGSLTIQPYESLPAVTLSLRNAEFHAEPNWYRNVEYLEELDRGLEFREDQFTPGTMTVTLEADQPATLVCFVGNRAGPSAEPPLRRKPPADEFRVVRADGKPTIVAGYPWFTDWGRDTMIAMPGLLLARPNPLLDEARRILEGFLGYLDRGLIPNRFPDAGETPEYNTCDATLWMFQAVHAYQQAGGDPSFFFDPAQEILDWHRKGSHYDIGVDPGDRLLRAGSPGSQLTWMDAKVGDWVVTPRHGKPVEINALWYNALKLTAAWLGDETLDEEAEVMASSFRTRFWNAERNGLFDVLGGDPAAKAKLRPNQIFAVSLPHSPLNDIQQRAVVSTVERELLTPFGLRTLDRLDPDYKPHYGGAPLARDGAYHQGTVWPWLLGPFIDAYLRVHGRTSESLRYAESLLAPLEAEFHRQGIGSLPEVYDAEDPHCAGGCPAQAWSVAEWLRAKALVSGA